MTIRLKNVTIDNCGVGISAPSDARIEADGLVITNTGRAIELKNPATFLGALGLPEDTPRELVIELLRQFRDKPAASSADAAARVRESGLLIMAWRNRRRYRNWWGAFFTPAERPHRQGHRARFPVAI